MKPRRLLITTLLLTGLAMGNNSAQSFKAQQAKYARVQAALAEKEAAIKQLFAAQRFAYPPSGIFLRAFKREGLIELWVKRDDRYERLKEYRVCAASGGLGPKRRQGDQQVPEGFYHIDRFNPASNFHLSLGVNYPNESDKILGAGGNLGGDIFIHGNCVSIGCLAITDGPIKELYLIAVEARAAGQTRIPVHIFPTRMNAKGIKQLEREAGANQALLNFWRNLQAGFEAFETTHRVPIVTVDTQGRYGFK
jgi:murein L,D-transpeptidase YafK